MRTYNGVCFQVSVVPNLSVNEHGSDCLLLPDVAFDGGTFPFDLVSQAKEQ